MMTDEISQDLDNQEELQPEEVGSESVEEKPSSKMYSAEHVARLVNKKSAKAHERGYQKAMNEFQQQQQIQQPAQQQTQQQPMVDEARVQELVNQQLQAMEQQRLMDQGKQLGHAFATKIEAAKEKYPDLKTRLVENKVETLHPAIISHANDLDNMADVMHDLMDPENASKLANLEMVAFRNPNNVKGALRKISETLKANEAAKQTVEQNKSNQPLRHTPSSHTGTDNGMPGVSELRKLKQYRK